MLNKKIKEIKKSLSHSQFKLTMCIFKEDVEFHNNFREKTGKELCEILGQAANIAIRF